LQNSFCVFAAEIKYHYFHIALGAAVHGVANQENRLLVKFRIAGYFEKNKITV